MPLIERTLFRHLLTILLGAALVYLFGEVHAQWSPMHRWNRATADAAITLLAVTMAIGPLARLWPRARRLVPMRRELGIHGVLLATVHTVIIFEGWFQWEVATLVGMALHPALDSFVMVQHGFGLANLIGLLALGYGCVLLATSNDKAVRWLGGPGWKFVQRGAYVYWSLVVVHTAYFLFMHFLDFHRPTPAPNPLQWPFVGLVLVVLALKWAAFHRTRRDARRKVSARSLPPGAPPLKAAAGSA